MVSTFSEVKADIGGKWVQVDVQEFVNFCYDKPVVFQKEEYTGSLSERIYTQFDEGAWAKVVILDPFKESSDYYIWKTI
jgi:hypothetical protein